MSTKIFIFLLTNNGFLGKLAPYIICVLYELRENLHIPLATLFRKGGNVMAKEEAYMSSKLEIRQPFGGWWKKALVSVVGTAVLALSVNAPVLAGMDDEFVTQDDLKALKDEVKTLRDELKSIKAVKPEVAPAITGNVYSELSRKIKLGGEVRARFESFYNFDFKGSPNDTFDDREGSHREITLLRTRLNLDADVNDYLRAYLELQDNRAFGDEDEGNDGGRKTGTDPFLNPRGTMGNLGRVDLLQGFLELKSLAPVSSALSDLSVKVGRFQMSYGGERLISEYDWSNQGRAFDGARIRWSGKDSSWIDGFVTQIDEDFLGPIDADSDEVFWGIYGHCTALKGVIDEIEPYFLGRNMSKSVGDDDPSFGSFGIPMSDITKEDRYTAGIRLAGEPTFLPGLDYEIEGAYQFGHVEVLGDDFDIDEAYAFFASAGYTLRDVPWMPRFGGGFSYATGTSGSQFDKGNINTFDQLYPSGYELGLGYMELVGWQNIIDYRASLSAKPTKKWDIKGDFHFLYLEEESDSWYNANGNAIAGWTGSGSKPNNQLGQEFDLTAKYALFKNFNLQLGYSHFFQGNFIESDNVETVDGSTFGGSDADWFYVMTTLKF